jgi:hypothetical protein
MTSIRREDLMVRRSLRIALSLGTLALAALSPAAARADEPAPAAPAAAGKVLVIAKVKEEGKRRQLEEEARTELRDRGVEATLGSDVLEESDFASEDAIRKKVESLGVDGVLGFVVLGVEENVKHSSASVSVGVGVPVNVGGFSIFLGGSVPLGGGAPKVTRKVSLRARYFARPFQAPAWEKVYKENLLDDTTPLVQYLAHDSVKALKKKKLIAVK